MHDDEGSLGHSRLVRKHGKPRSLRGRRLASRRLIRAAAETHIFIFSGVASFEKPSGSKKPRGAPSPTIPFIFIEMSGAALPVAAPIGAAKPVLQATEERASPR